ncbi:PfkB family carbohydrate kinase [Acidianus sp. RZ1]|uniref:PfkB family carbohydrate kinase n=1 Tax=Acidianus sp. RZ1 TaxID=1540082 RepID=UPI001492B31D|nr:PfkB family carbohydrate kinase [Acidianus sp. RZ1]NON61245.1 carbohydrate kinase family protein [Acidianus sp. RZ1]
MKPVHLAVGKFNIDIITKLNQIPSPDERSFTDILEILPGGSATNYSVAVNRLGHSSKLYAKTGKSSILNSLMVPLAEEGVGLEFVEHLDVKPSSAIIFLRDDGSISIVRKTTSSLLPSSGDVMRFSGMFDIIHFASIPPESIPKEIRTKLITYDPGAYASSYDGRRVDILFVNEKEHELLKSRVNADMVVVKRGSRGAYVYGSEECVTPALKIQAIDTTGAGDVFDAAFNVFMLEGEGIEDVLKYAIVASGLKVTRIGGISSPSLVEVMQRLKSEKLEVKCRA